MLAKKSNANTNATSRKPHNGFVLVGWLTFAPVVLSMMSAMVIFAWQLREATRLQSACEGELFRVYEIYGEHMTRLQKLNPKALRLRQELKRAQLILQAALISGNAVKIVAAERRLVKVELARAELSAEQNKILTAIKMAREQNIVRIRHKLHPDIKKIIIPHLAVHADIPQDAAPAYLENVPFEKEQSATLHYYLREPLRGNRTATRECRVSLEKRRTRYMPKLSLGFYIVGANKC
jgi:hypothetical protein